MQVHLRLQWVRHLVRGQYMNAELSMAGLGLIVMGGLQDELFNLTIDRIQARLSDHRSGELAVRIGCGRGAASRLPRLGRRCLRRRRTWRLGSRAASNASS